MTVLLTCMAVCRFLCCCLRRHTNKESDCVLQQQLGCLCVYKWGAHCHDHLPSPFVLCCALCCPVPCSAVVCACARALPAGLQQ